MPRTYGKVRLQAGQAKPPAWSLSSLEPQLRHRKIACRSADRRDCTRSSVVGIGLQEMTRLLRRRGRRAGWCFELALFHDLQQRRRKRNGQIGEELIRLGREQRSHNESDQ